VQLQVTVVLQQAPYQPAIKAQSMVYTKRKRRNGQGAEQLAFAAEHMMIAHLC
jgi:hypothetical protein